MAHHAGMDAAPLLCKIAAAFRKVKLEAVMIGNAAAALHGAPVTTLDVDFCYRSTPQNELKVRKLAEELDASLAQPFLPVSNLYRLTKPSETMQVDLMDAESIGLKLPSLRSRAVRVEFGGNPLLIADLGDIIRSKKRANRPKDHASLYTIEITHKEKQGSA